ncbi:uncharacterized protein C8R40DRAFT_1213142 [Lentinula edodes]|uniref:uncharacterized protein n=1 Tax=Lentinula edodes TaxID=5353 RepID=UPI001E8E8565|nr:uncharacterized protein C8R40DRAFT_1213142 [Lentinula edodes]KAH7870040.1 hypothetical protein C8R40DRAFT_1213142 [Lentinula edodes]
MRARERSATQSGKRATAMRSGFGIVSSHVAWDYCAFIITSYISHFTVHTRREAMLFHASSRSRFFDSLLSQPMESGRKISIQDQLYTCASFIIVPLSTFSSVMSLAACITVSSHIHGMGERAISAVVGSISVRPHPSTVSVGCLDTSVHPYALILVLGVDRWGITNLFYCCFLGGGVADTLLSAISSGTRILTVGLRMVDVEGTLWTDGMGIDSEGRSRRLFRTSQTTPDSLNKYPGILIATPRTPGPDSEQT